MIFEFYRSHYEEHDQWLFEHSDKSEDDFKADVLLTMKKYAPEYLAQEESWCGLDTFLQFVAPKMLELGYKYAERFSFGFFGGSILREGDDECKALEKIIDDDLQKMIEHNKKIEKELFNPNHPSPHSLT